MMDLNQATYDDPCNVSEIISKVRGRPRKENNKIHRVELRLTDEELEQLNYVSLTTGMSISQVITRALDNYYKIVNRRY